MRLCSCLLCIGWGQHIQGDVDCFSVLCSCLCGDDKRNPCSICANTQRSAIDGGCNVCTLSRTQLPISSTQAQPGRTIICDRVTCRGPVTIDSTIHNVYWLAIRVLPLGLT